MVACVLCSITERETFCINNRLLRNTETMFCRNDREDFYLHWVKLNERKGLTLIYVENITCGNS